MNLELWLVAGAVAISMLFERLLLPAVILIGVLLAIRLVTKAGFKRTPVDWGIAGLILMFPITLWATAIPAITITQVLRLLAGIGLFYAIVNGIKVKTHLQFASLGITILGIALALIGLVNTTWILDKLPLIPGSIYARLPTILADTIHPNVLAGYLVLLSPISLAILLFAWKDLPIRDRVLYSIAAALMTAVVLLTQSRGAISAYMVIAGVLITLRWKHGWIIFITISLIALIGVVSLGTGAFLDQTQITGDSAEKLEGRIEIWSRGIYMLKDFPLTGIGMGLFGDTADAIFPFFINRPGSVPHAHNLFLQIGIDLGVPGLISWLSIFLVIGYLSWRSSRIGLPDRWIAGLGAGIFCSQIGIAVHGMTDSVSWGMVKLAPIVWGVWGLAVAAWIIHVNGVNFNATHHRYD